MTIRRGTGSSTAKTETYHKLSEPDVTYKYVWPQDSAAGGLIDVFCDMEDGRIGYAAFTLQAVALMPAPAATEPMTKAHVLGRQAGVVCHLSQIFNLSLTRDGPDHIFSGFANTLMAMVEAKARTRGARLIYLEPSPSAVRTDPNTNDKKQQDPTGFYTTKHGYTADATAAIHNAAYTQQLYHGMDVSADDLARQTEQFNRAAVGGSLIKLL